MVRNAWLTATALGTTLVVWTTPTLGGALLAGLSQPDWLVALVVPAITAVLILWRESDGVEGDRGVPDLSATGSADLDYIRTRTPAIPVTLADGAIANLRALSVTRPMLLLAVSPYCGSCDGVHAQRKTWRALLPEVDVRLVLDESPADSSWTEGAEPQSLHDENDYVRDSLGYVSTPSAVLLGADGMLAGGPVTGDIAIERFVDDIYESLHGERPARVDSPA